MKGELAVQHYTGFVVNAMLDSLDDSSSDRVAFHSYGSTEHLPQNNSPSSIYRSSLNGNAWSPSVQSGN